MWKNINQKYHSLFLRSKEILMDEIKPSLTLFAYNAKFTQHDFSLTFHLPTGCADTWEIFGILNIWSCWWFTIRLCEWVLTEKYISDDLQPMREQDTVQLEAQGGQFYCNYFTKRLTLAIYKQRAYIFGIRIYRAGKLHEDEEGARVFPVNNILL